VTTADCTRGGVCTSLPEGGRAPILAISAEAFLVCSPADGGA
jgi:hypothetical protein